MSGRFSNTSANPRSRGQRRQLRPGIGDDGEPTGAGGPLPGPLEVAARLDRGARLRRREVQRALRRARRRRCGRWRPGRWCRARGGAAGPGPGSKVRASTSGNRLDPPMPITSTSSMPSTSASQRAASAGQVGEHLPHDREPPEPVGDLGGVVAPERVVGRRTAGATASRSTRSATTASRGVGRTASCGAAYPAAARSCDRATRRRRRGDRRRSRR